MSIYIIFLVIIIIILVLTSKKTGSNEVGAVLGYGMVGTVYEYFFKNSNKIDPNKVVKFSKILEKDYLRLKDAKFTESEFLTFSDITSWREIYFTKRMCKYPNQFMQVYDTKFINCPKFYIQKYSQSINKFNSKVRKLFINLAKSQFCKKQICSHIDGTFDKYFTILDNSMIDKSKCGDFLNIFINQIYLIVLMESEGFCHNDFHLGNIGFKYTSDKFIETEFGRIKLPYINYIKKSYIYIVAIDFELVSRITKPFFKKNKSDDENLNSDFNFILGIVLYESDFEANIEKSGININWDKLKIKYLQTPEAKIIADKLQININNPKILKQVDYDKFIFFFKCEFGDLFQQIALPEYTPTKFILCEPFTVEIMYDIVKLNNIDKLKYLLKLENNI